MALIEAGKLDDASAKPAAKPPAPQPKPEVKPDAPSEARVEAKAEAPPAPAPDVSEVAKPDPETARRLSTIQQAEKRHREQIAASKAEIEESRKAIDREWSPRVKAAEEFEALKAKARKGSIHLVDAVRALGLGEDDFEAAAQALYAHSKAGQADPTRRAAAERMMAERAQSTEQSALQKRLDDLEAKLAQKDQATEFDRLRAGYLDNAVKSITDDMPIAKALAAKNPSKLRAALWQHTVELTEELDGDVPDFADVVARYEAARRDELEELGLAPPTKTAPDTKQNNEKADKQNPAKTLGADLSAPRVPRENASGKDHRAETRRMIESGKLE